MLTALILATSLSASPVEITVAEKILQELLVELAPIEQGSNLTIMGGQVRVNLKLTDPEVKITPKAIKVTMKYEAWDDGGLIKLKGTAYPEMDIVKVQGKQRFQGRLTRSGIKLAGGIELPIERYVAPINLPALMQQSYRLGKKTVTANVLLTEVVLEKGLIRMKGDVTF